MTKKQESHALIVVDVQNDFIPGGNLAVPGGDEIVPLVNQLIEVFHHVVLTQDWHPPGHHSFASSYADKKPFETVALPYGTQTLWPEHCVQGTAGAAFHPDLNTNMAELILRKGYRKEIDSYSAFFENDQKTPTGLVGYLKERGITSLFMVGLALDFCVGWSAIDGRRNGFDVTVIQDATRAIDTAGSLDAALQNMQDAGVTLVNAADL